MHEIVARSGAPAGNRSAPQTRPSRTQPADTALHVVLQPLAGCEQLRPDWADLAARTIEPNPFFEPGILLAASQHLVAFRDVALAQVWQGTPGLPGSRLVGLLPCRPPHRLFSGGPLSGLSNPHLLSGAPLLDRALAEPAAAALLQQAVGHLQSGHGLSLPAIDLQGPAARAILAAGSSLGLTASVQALQPHAVPLSDDPAPEPSARLAFREASSRGDMRDAVEWLLAFEASGAAARAGAATLQDTREAGFLRAMTRSLAGTRQCRVGLLSLDGQPIAGAIVIGKAGHGWLYMQARDERHETLDPSRRLLAMMRAASPARQILTALDAGRSHGALRLSPPARRSPRDLAERARAALWRSVFRLQRAGFGG